MNRCALSRAPGEGQPPRQLPSLPLQLIRGCQSARRASKLLTIARRASIDPSALLTGCCRRSEVRSLRPGITHLSGIIDGCEVHALRQVLVPLPRILVLGAGPDAAPVVQGFLALVWRVTVGDEREGALTRAELGSVERLYVRHDVNLTEFLHRAMPSAIIIMSHNLRANARYLRLVADCDCVYLGVLGPGHRRERLLEGLEPQVKSRVKSRLRGPIGLHIGADSPASIALSIVTQVFIEIKAFLSEAGSVPPAEDAEKLTAGRVTRADRASSLG
jgi:xanthine/CO dehydrogenase XdhC/CoxF family maturation factor